MFGIVTRFIIIIGTAKFLEIFNKPILAICFFVGINIVPRIIVGVPFSNLVIQTIILTFFITMFLSLVSKNEDSIGEWIAIVLIGWFIYLNF